MISALLSANLDGEHLSQVELLGFCVLLLVAGMGLVRHPGVDVTVW